MGCGFSKSSMSHPYSNPDKHNHTPCAIDLERYVTQQREERKELLMFLMDCSQIESRDIWICITGYLWTDFVLIPNTTNKEEFLEYWSIVPNGSRNSNRYKDHHRVEFLSSPTTHRHSFVDNTISMQTDDVSSDYTESYKFDDESSDDIHTDSEQNRYQSDQTESEQNLMIRLIQRGAIASIHQYIPSKRAKLKIECTFQWQSDDDYLTFTTRSDGKRDIRTRHQMWGGLDYGGRAMRVCQGWGRPRMEIEMSASHKPMTWKCLKKTPKWRTVSVQIIDDGERVQMIYTKEDGVQYSLENTTTSMRSRSKSGTPFSRLSSWYHLAIWNREQPDCILDISSLTVSVVPVVVEHKDTVTKANGTSLDSNDKEMMYSRLSYDCGCDSGLKSLATLQYHDNHEFGELQPVHDLNHQHFLNVMDVKYRCILLLFPSLMVSVLTALLLMRFTLSIFGADFVLELVGFT